MNAQQDTTPRPDLNPGFRRSAPAVSPFDATTAAFEAEARALLAQLPDRAVALCLHWLEVEAQAKTLDDQITARAAELRAQGVPLEDDPAMVDLNAKLDEQGWRLDAVRAEIAATPATTPAGVLAKLVVWQTEQGVPQQGDCDHAFARSAANDLRRMIAAGQWGRAA